MSAVKNQNCKQAKKLVITRHQAGGHSFGNLITQKNPEIDILLMPMLQIEDVDTDLDDISIDMHLITTSQQALCRIDGLPNPVYKIDSDTGITDAQALITHIESQHDKAVPLLYLRGRDVSTDLKSELTNKGFCVEEKIVYQAKAAEALNEDFIAALKAGEVAYVTFFSKRTAEIFESLILKAQLQGLIESVSALCLSTQVVNSLTALPWHKRLYSETKDRMSMLALINKVYVD